MAQLYTFGKNHLNHKVIELVQLYLKIKLEYDEHEKTLIDCNSNILNGINQLENLEIHRNQLVANINELYIKICTLCKDIIETSETFCNLDLLFDLVNTKNKIEKLKIEAKEEIIKIENRCKIHGIADAEIIDGITDAEIIDEIEKKVEEKWAHFLSLIPKIKEKFIFDPEMEEFFKDNDINEDFICIKI